MARNCIYNNKNQLNVRIDEATKEKALAKAKAEGKTLSQVIVMAVNQFIEKPKK
jgi:antitoxin component of RelBE/YafQ-DinJ toxin-antitoxin module